VLFLNPDVTLLPGCLQALSKSLLSEGADAAAAQPKLVLPKIDNDGRRLLDSTGMVLSIENLSPYDRDHGRPDDGSRSAKEYIFGPTGACALWHRDALEALLTGSELFDEKFFAYYEDVDLAWRGAKAGFRFIYEPGAVAVHDRKNPPFHGGETDARAFANRYLLLAKNATGGQAFKVLLRNLPRESARWLYKTLTQPGFAEAWRHLARGLPSAVEYRKSARQPRREK
jgi:GT2 family glycosyltransferase